MDHTCKTHISQDFSFLLGYTHISQLGVIDSVEVTPGAFSHRFHSAVVSESTSAQTPWIGISTETEKDWCILT